MQTHKTDGNSNQVLEKCSSLFSLMSTFLLPSTHLSPNGLLRLSEKLLVTTVQILNFLEMINFSCINFKIFSMLIAKKRPGGVRMDAAHVTQQRWKVWQETAALVNKCTIACEGPFIAAGPAVSPWVKWESIWCVARQVSGVAAFGGD